MTKDKIMMTEVMQHKSATPLKLNSKSKAGKTNFTLKSLFEKVILPVIFAVWN